MFAEEHLTVPRKLLERPIAEMKAYKLNGNSPGGQNDYRHGEVMKRKANKSVVAYSRDRAKWKN